MGNKQTQPLVISRPTKYEEPLPDINILSLKNNINDKSVLKIIILHLYFDNNFPNVLLEMIINYLQVWLRGSC